jgi:hypothetical protein
VGIKMKIENLHENLSRTVKLAVDNGEASTVEEAENIFGGYRIGVEVGNGVASSPTMQAAVLTIVNTARRCFLGGVLVAGNLDVALLVPWRKFKYLSEAVADLRGEVVDVLPSSVPCLLVGKVSVSCDNMTIALQLTFDGWCGGIAPHEDRFRLPESQEFIPSGVLAGALGVSEVFQYVRGDNPLACHRMVGISLWNPSSRKDWYLPENRGPAVKYLPGKVWVLGLGHLGQAFLWTLGLLPYAKPEDVQLILQDFDKLTPANESTSLLTFSPVPKEMKSRAMGKWCKERGFNSILVERRFASDFKIANTEPSVAVCGFDNALSRTALEEVGFSRIIEAGLGKEGNEYLSFSIHTFPGPKKASVSWGNTHTSEDFNASKIPAYKDLVDKGLDECGITILAGRTVGASFVGTIASTLVVAELLKMIHGGQSCAVIDGTLRSLDSIEAIGNESWNEPYNPGVTATDNAE